MKVHTNLQRCLYLPPLRPPKDGLGQGEARMKIAIECYGAIWYHEQSRGQFHGRADKHNPVIATCETGHQEKNSQLKELAYMALNPTNIVMAPLADWY